MFISRLFFVRFLMAFSGLFVMIFFTNAVKVINPTIIYVSLSGHDESKGTDPTDPILSLSRANEIANKLRQERDRPIIVQIKAGIYFGESVQWTSYSKIYETKIEAETFGTVTFDGRESSEEILSNSSNFFVFNPTTGGSDTNIKIRGLKLSFYLEPIIFSSPFMVEHVNSIGNNSIENCVFEKNGNMFAHVSKSTTEIKIFDKGTAVVFLNNVVNSHFLGNKFVNNNNLPTFEPSKKFKLPNSARIESQGYHGFYLSHHSSNNLFEGNSFVDHHSGAAIRLRDQSDDNSIIRNHFVKVSPVAIEHWHCELQESTECPDKVQPECRSWGTKEMANIIETSVGENAVAVYESKAGYSCKSAIEEKRPQISRKEDGQTGILQSTMIDEKQYFGICKAATDCVSTQNECVSAGGVFKGKLCEANTWYACDKSTELMQVGSHICLSDKGHLEVTWTEIPRGWFFVKNNFKDSSFQGFCGHADDCINSQGECFSELESSKHEICHHQKWITCDENNLDLVQGSKVCIKEVSGREYHWLEVSKSEGAEGLGSAVSSF